MVSTHFLFCSENRSLNFNIKSRDSGRPTRRGVCKWNRFQEKIFPLYYQQKVLKVKQVFSIKRPLFTHNTEILRIRYRKCLNTPAFIPEYPILHLKKSKINNICSAYKNAGIIQVLKCMRDEKYN